MIAFGLAVGFTLGVSALCSVLEAMILSTRSVEVEALKHRRPAAGKLLENFRSNLESSISGVLTVNTVANTLGSIVVGAMATNLFGTWWVGVISGLMTLGILLFSEIIPKNIGVIYRVSLQPVMVYPLVVICWIAAPVSFCTRWLVGRFFPTPEAQPGSNEILLLAGQESTHGRLDQTQHRLIHAALELDEARVSKVMTPRSVVVCGGFHESVHEFRERYPRVPFARIPVMNEEEDDVVGVVRRKDLLQVEDSERATLTLGGLMLQAVFIPEVAKISSAIEQLLAAHQQLGVVVDEFGAFAGVVTLEDIFEFLVGREFYEKDDVAVDMRELAVKKSLMAIQRKRPK